MIQKKKFSDALTANKEVLGGIIGTVTEAKDGLFKLTDYRRFMKCLYDNKDRFVKLGSVGLADFQAGLLYFGRANTFTIIAYYIRNHGANYGVDAKFLMQSDENIHLFYKGNLGTEQITFYAKASNYLSFNSVGHSVLFNRINHEGSVMANIDETVTESELTEVEIA